MTDDRDLMDVPATIVGTDFSVGPDSPVLVIHHERDGGISVLSDVPIRLVEVFERMQGPPLRKPRTVSAIGREFIACLLGRTTTDRMDGVPGRVTAGIDLAGERPRQRPRLSIVRSES